MGHPYYTRWGGDGKGRWFSDCSCHRFQWADSLEEAEADFAQHCLEAHGVVWPNDDDEDRLARPSKEFVESVEGH